jgi:hypothetical protein
MEGEDTRPSDQSIVGLVDESPNPVEVAKAEKPKGLLLLACRASEGGMVEGLEDVGSSFSPLSAQAELALELGGWTLRKVETVEDWTEVVWRDGLLLNFSNAANRKLVG